MAENESTKYPIQFFLDTRKHIGTIPTKGGGGGKDFFHGRNDEFANHKQSVCASLASIAEEYLERRLLMGFLKVQVQEEALAKSHRPTWSVFTPGSGFPVVGGGKEGEMHFQCVPNRIARLMEKISSKAEISPRVVWNSNKNAWEERASRCRCEVGAIEKVSSFSRADKVDFSVDQALDVMSGTRATGGYTVELFRPEFLGFKETAWKVVKQFEDKLLRHGSILARPLIRNRLGRPPIWMLEVDLASNEQESGIDVHFNEVEGEVYIEPRGGVSKWKAERSGDPVNHRRLLKMLAEEPLVKRVALPLELQSNPANVAGHAQPVEIPAPRDDHSYPVVGILDGGVAELSNIQKWSVGNNGPVTPEDREYSHGTFIAGLIVAGGNFNDAIRHRLEMQPCKYLDLPIIPRPENWLKYHRGIPELCEEIDELVKRAKEHSGVRVFNVSFNGVKPRKYLSYSEFAASLDEIALENDILFVVSAGNLSKEEIRPEWPELEEDVHKMLAERNSVHEGLAAPADHLLGLTIGAINTPNVAHASVDRPTVYTRRGPGPNGARKPDLSHYGGTPSMDGCNSGLCSLAADGSLRYDCGTSYAAPLVASTLATLNHRLGNKAQRELLMALMVHNAARHESLEKQGLSHVASDFVGYDRPCNAEECMSGNSYEFTLVFSDVIRCGQTLEYEFAWPKLLVGSNGECRGEVCITLAYTPLIDSKYAAECQRVSLDANLQQYHRKINKESGEVEYEWERKLNQIDEYNLGQLHHNEKRLLKRGLKWTPIKGYSRRMPRGVGNMSNWKLSLSTLLRDNARMPALEICFALIMTLRDLKRTERVFSEMRSQIINSGARISDMQTAHEIKL